MVAVSILHHAEFGPNDHREDAPHFNFRNVVRVSIIVFSVEKRVRGSPVPVDVFQFNVLPLILVPI